MIEELNKETLEQLYLREHKTAREIARLYGCSAGLVNYRCKKYKIKMRTSGDYKTIKIKKSVLYKLCIEEGKTLKEAAKILSCCSPSTIQGRFKEYGISLMEQRKIKGLTKPLLKRLYVKKGKAIREIAKIVGCSHETVRNRCNQLGISLRPSKETIEIDETALRRLYIQKGKTFTEIAKIFDCSVSVVSKRVKQFGLQKRT